MRRSHSVDVPTKYMAENPKGHELQDALRMRDQLVQGEATERS